MEGEEGDGMSDLIDRQAAINALEFGITYAKAVNRETGEVTELFKQSNDELKKAIERIQKLPTAEPRCYLGSPCEYQNAEIRLPTAEPKTGRWISDRLVSTNGGTYGIRRCSECEAYYQDIGYGWNFCPTCGARMEGEDNGVCK